MSVNIDVGHLLYDCRGTLKRQFSLHGKSPLTLSLGMSTLSFDIDAVITGKSRLSDAQGLELYQKASTRDLGVGPWRRASASTPRIIEHTSSTATSTTPTSARPNARSAPPFAATTRMPMDTLSFEQIGKKISELVSIGGTQILMQGGMNDRLRIEYYEDLLRYIKTNFPVHIPCIFAAGIGGVRAVFRDGCSGHYSAAAQRLDDDSRRRRHF